MQLSATDVATLQGIEFQITGELKRLQPEALRRYASITKREPKLLSFHAVIGGKNNTYVDSVRTQFPDFRDFLAKWLQGLNRAVYRGGTVNLSCAAYMIMQLLQDEVICKYTFLFLERNFYRNFVERTRAKPGESLWSLWFGNNQMTWGLLIAPAFRGAKWTNDKSEMRRAPYVYWTVGQVLAEGFVDPSVSTPYKFHSLEMLLDFYRSILKRVSNSLYEREIADRYVAYIDLSADPESEPFLIPELRYAGLAKEHMYRLDYAVLNTYTLEHVGFELSPHSTHYFMNGITKKTQVEINGELAGHWEKEMEKRNRYFAEFGITTVTFTDYRLADLDGCFKTISGYLSKRPESRPTVENELAKMSAHFK